MKLEFLGRDGAKTKVRITGATTADFPSINMLFPDGDGLRGSLNKRDVAIVEKVVYAANHRPQPVPQNGPKRIMVRAGTVRVGDELMDHTVTGLGRIWIPNCDQLAANGLHPSTDMVQYAYIG